MNIVFDHYLAYALSSLALHLQCQWHNEVENNHGNVQVIGVVFKTKKKDVDSSYPSEEKLCYSNQKLTRNSLHHFCVFNLGTIFVLLLNSRHLDAVCSISLEIRSTPSSDRTVKCKTFIAPKPLVKSHEIFSEYW